MSRIDVWFDGGGAYGIGNVLRSRELAARLGRRGHAVELRPMSARAAALAGLAHAETVATDADVVVLDLPYDGDALQATARAQGARVLALDYEGRRSPDHVVSLQAVRALPAGAPHSVGFDYAIVRDEFLRLRQQPPGRTNEVLVILGGGDASALASQVVERLIGIAKQITVVQGPAADASASPKRQAAHVQYIATPADLPQRMARCRWAVSTGGTTMLELLCLGTAVHVVPRTPAEQVFADAFMRAGAVLGVGLDTLEAPADAARLRCQTRGPQLIDGRGCERIAEQVEALASMGVAA